jgi:hypothetical protein
MSKPAKAEKVVNNNKTIYKWHKNQKINKTHKKDNKREKVTWKT